MTGWLTDGSARRTDAFVVLGLVAVGAIVPLLTSALAGTLEVPRNDDWSYRRIAADLASTDQLKLDGAAWTMLVGQVVLTQPLLWLSGGQPWAFTVAGFAFAVTAVIASYALGRQFLPPLRAGLVAAILPLFPGYLAYATSYMNDVPALATQFIAIALGATALARRPVAFRRLVATALIGCLAFSMRHFALAAPASIALVALLAEPRRPRAWLLVCVTGAVCLTLLVWRSSLPGQIGGLVLDTTFASRLPSAIVTIAFVLLPASIVAIATTGRHWSRRHVLLGALIGEVFVALWVAPMIPAIPDALMENLATRWGVPAHGYLMGSRPVLIPQFPWAILNAVALLSIVIGAASIAGAAGLGLSRSGASLRRPLVAAGSARSLLLIFIVLTGAGLALFGVFFPLYDRYLWPMVPVLAVLMISPTGAEARAQRPFPRRVMAASLIASCMVLAAFGLTLMANSHAFDAARWRAGERLLEEGVPADQIDAGYEWVGTTP